MFENFPRDFKSQILAYLSSKSARCVVAALTGCCWLVAERIFLAGFGSDSDFYLDVD